MLLQAEGTIPLKRESLFCFFFKVPRMEGLTYPKCYAKNATRVNAFHSHRSQVGVQMCIVRKKLRLSGVSEDTFSGPQSMYVVADIP